MGGDPRRLERERLEQRVRPEQRRRIPDVRVERTLRQLHPDAPLPDDLRPNEYDILLSGAYNLGFIATNCAGETGEFLRWWQRKMRKYCYVDHYRGYFVDQKWIDLVPGMFRGVHILMDPGYNTAYWNLHSRRVEPDNGGYTVNGRPATDYVNSTADTLGFNRALNSDGTAWGNPLTVVSNVQAADVSMAVVDSRPAMCYRNEANGYLTFVQAVDASGTAWNAPVVIDLESDAVGGSLCDVGGHPAIAYFDMLDDDLRFAIRY